MSEGNGVRHILPMSDGEYEDIVQTLAATTASTARGSSASTTTYLLEPRMWMREIVNAAKKDLRYAEGGMIKDIPKGNANLIIPKQKQYLAGGSWGANVTPGTAVNQTALSNYDGVELVPTWYNSSVAVTYDVIQQNVVDYVGQAREELTYRAGDIVDQAVVTAISGATESTSTAAGSSTIFGGDATQASELTDGDIITTDMVAEGRKKLTTDSIYYWVGGTGESKAAKASYSKNPWKNNDDFLLYIAPEQEEAFLTDSQFINASEYGSNKVIMNGEIGTYLNTKIIVSNNTKQVASAGVGTTDGSAAGTDINTCVMVKAKKGYALGYLKRPTLHIMDYPRQLEVDLILEQAFGAKTVHDDAIVHINVSQV
ncbi:MAG TPA: N4-gp56 family major capsid protein [candidate division Zixibacteria bacterium]|nr:N4-gp56 family major capsid protein [candidate division Zixibacteria bacterium]